jgi:polyphosphate kinase 2 (PPK2 family)
MKQLKRKRFEELYAPLEQELVAMARWVAATGARVMVLFEGRDTAGKGGAIQSVARPLNPRQCRTIALPKPSERESSQWYFQRYVAHLPAAGEIVLFDRSWYNRAGVEKVMGYASPAQIELFLKQAPAFERMLIEDGVLLFKYWLATDQASRKSGWRSGWTTRSSAGSCPRSIWPRATSTMNTPVHAMRCCAPRTPPNRPGP